MSEIALREKSCICGGEALEVIEVTHLPLFRDAGYGEAIRVRSEICLDCWTVRELSRESLNPLNV